MQGQPSDRSLQVDPGHSGPYSWNIFDVKSTVQPSHARPALLQGLVAGQATLLPAVTPRNHMLTSPLELEHPFDPVPYVEQQLSWLQRVHQESFLPQELALQLLVEDVAAGLQQPVHGMAAPAQGGDGGAGADGGSGPNYDACASALRGNRLAAVELPHGSTLVASATGQIGDVLSLTVLRWAGSDDDDVQQQPANGAVGGAAGVGGSGPGRQRLQAFPAAHIALNKSIWQVAAKRQPPAPGMGAAAPAAAARAPADGGVWLAVRCNYAINVLLAYQVDPADWRSWRLEWRSQLLTQQLTAHVAWNPHLPELAYVLADGSAALAPTQACHGGTVASLRRLEPWPLLKPCAQPPDLTACRLCCAYGAHPRTLLVARGGDLLRLQLSAPGSGRPHGVSRLLQLAPREGGIWALLPGSGQGPQAAHALPHLLHYVLVVATHQVLLLDLRRAGSAAGSVVLAVQHGLPGHGPALAALRVSRHSSDAGCSGAGDVGQDQQAPGPGQVQGGSAGGVRSASQQPSGPPQGTPPGPAGAGSGRGRLQAEPTVTLTQPEPFLDLPSQVGSFDPFAADMVHQSQHAAGAHMGSQAGPSGGMGGGGLLRPTQASQMHDPAAWLGGDGGGSGGTQGLAPPAQRQQQQPQQQPAPADGGAGGEQRTSYGLYGLQRGGAGGDAHCLLLLADEAQGHVRALELLLPASPFALALGVAPRPHGAAPPGGEPQLAPHLPCIQLLPLGPGLGPAGHSQQEQQEQQPNPRGPADPGGTSSSSREGWHASMSGGAAPRLSDAEWQLACLGPPRVLGLPYVPCGSTRSDLGQDLVGVLQGCRAALYAPPAGLPDTYGGLPSRPAQVAEEVRQAMSRSPDLAGVGLAAVAACDLLLLRQEGAVGGSSGSGGTASGATTPPVLLLRLSYDGDVLLQPLERTMAAFAPAAGQRPRHATAAAAAAGGGRGALAGASGRSAPGASLDVELLESPHLMPGPSAPQHPAPHEVLLRCYQTLRHAFQATHHLPQAGWSKRHRYYHTPLLQLPHVPHKGLHLMYLKVHYVHMAALLAWAAAAAAAEPAPGGPGAEDGGGSGEQRAAPAGRWRRVLRLLPAGPGEGSGAGNAARGAAAQGEAAEPGDGPTGAGGASCGLHGVLRVSWEPQPTALPDRAWGLMSASLLPQARQHPKRRRRRAGNGTDGGASEDGSSTSGGSSGERSGEASGDDDVAAEAEAEGSAGRSDVLRELAGIVRQQTRDRLLSSATPCTLGELLQLRQDVPRARLVVQLPMRQELARVERRTGGRLLEAALWLASGVVEGSPVWELELHEQLVMALQAAQELQRPPLHAPEAPGGRAAAATQAGDAPAPAGRLLQLAAVLPCAAGNGCAVAGAPRPAAADDDVPAAASNGHAAPDATNAQAAHYAASLAAVQDRQLHCGGICVLVPENGPQAGATDEGTAGGPSGSSLPPSCGTQPRAPAGPSQPSHSQPSQQGPLRMPQALAAAAGHSLPLQQGMPQPGTKCVVLTAAAASAYQQLLDAWPATESQREGPAGGPSAPRRMPSPYVAAAPDGLRARAEAMRPTPGSLAPEPPAAAAQPEPAPGQQTRGVGARPTQRPARAADTHVAQHPGADAAAAGPASAPPAAAAAAGGASQVPAAGATALGGSGARAAAGQGAGPGRQAPAPVAPKRLRAHMEGF